VVQVHGGPKIENLIFRENFAQKLKGVYEVNHLMGIFSEHRDSSRPIKTPN